MQLVAINKGLELLTIAWMVRSEIAGHWLPTQDFYACTAAQEQGQFTYKACLQ